jgi:DNA-binding MarR family transcriptional regulator
MEVDSKEAALCACFNLRKATRSLTSFYDEKLREHDITTPQFTVLIALDVLEESQVTPLAEWLVMDRTTLTRNLDRLKENELIESKRGEEDRRTKLVMLSEKGERTLEQAFPQWKEAQDTVIDELGEDRFHQLVDILGQIPEIGD